MKTQHDAYAEKWLRDCQIYNWMHDQLTGEVHHLEHGDDVRYESIYAFARKMGMREQKAEAGKESDVMDTTELIRRIRLLMAQCSASEEEMYQTLIEESAGWKMRLEELED